jgi:hypothetical protein
VDFGGGREEQLSALLLLSLAAALTLLLTADSCLDELKEVYVVGFLGMPGWLSLEEGPPRLSGFQ